ncbi:MAG: D-alanyl-D-alanine carboxypeptidase family protein [Legionellaceae bacterium]|nr:D-alanyl-D-alanine carboxypeptidase family protein [Legionellaceae bacterium]
MNTRLKLIALILCGQMGSFSLYAEETLINQAPSAQLQNRPIVIPAPPAINAKEYILIDVQSGKVLADKNSEVSAPPASLTKMMTLYVISNALAHNQIHLSDLVRISKDAWQAEGSRMFVKEGQMVSIEDLVKGIIVDSGNDACIAMAEHLGGSEPGFSQIMNDQAKALGMQHSYFTDSTGLPNEKLQTTAKDLAILGRALILNFPQYYPWYQQKWFKFNDIRQPNRNRLLWRDASVDGLKTGHTDDAGFCLVSSAKQDNMRLLAVVLGEPTDAMRADDSQKLLNYGFRFYETHQMFKANQTIKTLPVYKGESITVAAGVTQAVYATVPKGQYAHLQVETEVSKTLQAPIQQGEVVGQIRLIYDQKVLARYPLQALQPINKGGVFTRMKDSMKLTFIRWFG